MGSNGLCVVCVHPAPASLSVRRTAPGGGGRAARAGLDFGGWCTPGQIVTFFAYRHPSRPLGSLTPTQPGRVTNPTQGHPGPPGEAPLRQSAGVTTVAQA
jgi:hypothetical protein